MNKNQARAILSEHMARYQQQSYTELLRLLEEQDTFETALIGGEAALFLQPAGAPDDFAAAPVYQVEIDAVWANEPDGALLIFASIDDGGLFAYFPLTDGFNVWPDGTVKACLRQRQA